jgi:hypothetical protein
VSSFLLLPALGDSLEINERMKGECCVRPNSGQRSRAYHVWAIFLGRKLIRHSTRNEGFLNSVTTAAGDFLCA